MLCSPSIQPNACARDIECHFTSTCPWALSSLNFSRKLLSSPKEYNRTPQNMGSHVLQDSYDERGRTKMSSPALYNSPLQGLRHFIWYNLYIAKLVLLMSSSTQTAIPQGAGRHLLSRRFQRLTTLPSTPRLIGKDTQTMSGKRSPKSTPKNPWKNSCLLLTSANGRSLMLKESLWLRSMIMRALAGPLDFATGYHGFKPHPRSSWDARRDVSADGRSKINLDILLK